MKKAAEQLREVQKVSQKLFGFLVLICFTIVVPSLKAGCVPVVDGLAFHKTADLLKILIQKRTAAPVDYLSTFATAPLKYSEIVSTFIHFVVNIQNFIGMLLYLYGSHTAPDLRRPQYHHCQMTPTAAYQTDISY